MTGMERLERPQRRRGRVGEGVVMGVGLWLHYVMSAGRGELGNACGDAHREQRVAEPAGGGPGAVTPGWSRPVTAPIPGGRLQLFCGARTSWRVVSVLRRIREPSLGNTSTPERCRKVRARSGQGAGDGTAPGARGAVDRAAGEPAARRFVWRPASVRGRRRAARGTSAPGTPPAGAAGTCVRSYVRVPVW